MEIGTANTGRIAAEENETSKMIDRRRHRRRRLTVPITLSANTPSLHGPTVEGATIEGITIEISESGLSAAINAPLALGDRVILNSIGGADVQAVVRRITGRIYGFQFLNLTAEQTQKLREQCRWLPLYNSIFDFRPNC